jgi:hypothetical protein
MKKRRRETVSQGNAGAAKGNAGSATPIRELRVRMEIEVTSKEGAHALTSGCFAIPSAMMDGSGN